MHGRISVSLNCSTLYWILKRDIVGVRLETDTDILVYCLPGVIKFPVEHAGNTMTHWRWADPGKWN